MRWSIFCLVILFSFPSGSSFAQSNKSESLTITTYYPAPYGVYRNLKLNPSNQPTGAAVSEGVMYFNQTNKNVYIYRNSTLGWQALGGVASQLDTNNTVVCDASHEGSVRYNFTIKNIQFCNGTAWQDNAMMYSGMVAGRIAISPISYSRCGSGNIINSESCSASLPGGCVGTSHTGTANNCPAPYETTTYTYTTYTPVCQSGWSVFLQSKSGTTSIYACSYN